MWIAAITCVINGATVAASICCSRPLARDQGLVAEITRRRLCLQNIFLLLLLKMEIIQRGGSRQIVWKSTVFLKDGVPLIKVIIIIFLLSLLYQNKMPLFLYQEGSRSFTTSSSLNISRYRNTGAEATLSFFSGGSPQCWSWCWSPTCCSALPLAGKSAPVTHGKLMAWVWVLLQDPGSHLDVK